jgi:hypothetical protein
MPSVKATRSTSAPGNYAVTTFCPVAIKRRCMGVAKRLKDYPWQIS